MNVFLDCMLTLGTKNKHLVMWLPKSTRRHFLIHVLLHKLFEFGKCILYCLQIVKISVKFCTTAKLFCVCLFTRPVAGGAMLITPCGYLVAVNKTGIHYLSYK